MFVIVQFTWSVNPPHGDTDIGTYVPIRVLFIDLQRLFNSLASVTVKVVLDIWLSNLLCLDAYRESSFNNISYSTACVLILWWGPYRVRYLTTDCMYVHSQLIRNWVRHFQSMHRKEGLCWNLVAKRYHPFVPMCMTTAFCQCLSIRQFINTSALPVGFLPDLHSHKLMIKYSMIKLPRYPLPISPARRSINGRGDDMQTNT